MTVYRNMLLLLLLVGDVAAYAGPEVLLETVKSGDRLDISNFAGEIRIETWDQQRVRIVADRRKGEDILLTRSGSVVRVRARSWDEASDSLRVHDNERAVLRLDGNAQPGIVNYQVTVPAWLQITAGGAQTDISVEDLAASVDITVFQGKVLARRHRGDLSVRSLGGELRVEQMTGTLRMRGWQSTVTLVDTKGDLTIETTSGSISMSGHVTGGVEAVTVVGDISYAGALPAHGSVSLATHSGDVSLSLPPETDAAVTVRTLRGRFTSDFVEDEPRGKSFRFQIGSGRSILDLESFSGRIQINTEH